LNGSDYKIDFDDVNLINTKENLEKLQFNAKKWNLQKENFIIYGKKDNFLLI
jgi:hypothetical protein